MGALYWAHATTLVRISEMKRSAGVRSEWGKTEDKLFLHTEEWAVSLQYNNVLHIKLFHTYICEINKQLAPNGQSNTRARVCPNSFPFSKWSYQTKIHNMTLYTKLINHETGTIFSLSLSAFHIFEQKCNLREYKFNTFLKREKKQ